MIKVPRHIPKLLAPLSVAKLSLNKLTIIYKIVQFSAFVEQVCRKMEKNQMEQKIAVSDVFKVKMIDFILFFIIRFSSITFSPENKKPCSQ